MKAKTIRKFFSRETEVEIDIRADPAKIWSLLTKGADYPKWTSTVLSIDGDIGKGQVIKLRSHLDPKRIFKLKVYEFEPSRQLVWGDAMGKRSYTLTPKSTTEVRFSMRERIGGPLFPLFAGMIPSFDESFDQFAADLKKRAEAA